MTPRFDRSKPFGEVIPTGGYWQNGHYFDAHGEFVRSDVLPAMEEPKAPEPAVGGAVGEVDLAAYARNTVKWPHYMILRAMKAAYPDGEFGTKRETIVDFLVDQSVVTEAEAVR